MLEFIGRTRTQRGTIPAGDRGTEATLAIMRQLVDGPNGARNLLVYETARRILGRVVGAEHNPVAQLRALYLFVRDSIRFVGDVRGVETLQSPRYTLQVKAGDCDDRATLIAALARSVGLPADFRFRVVGANPASPGTYSHVYVMARLNGRDYALDPTYHANPFDYQYPFVSRIGDYAL